MQKIKLQKQLIKNGLAALKKYKNTLLVGPTGVGKTYMFCMLIVEWLKGKPLDKKVLVIAHRDKLTDQNRNQFVNVSGCISTSIFNRVTKSWDGNVIFAMVKTLANDVNLHSMPKIDLIVIDEAHHVVAESYLKIIRHAKKINPNVNIVGFTATPKRSDRQGLRSIFNNVGGHITLAEGIKIGRLVQPKTFVIDVGVTDKLSKVRKIADEYDATKVASILDTYDINHAVINKWRELASDRQTVIFCSKESHAINVARSFNCRGIKTEVIVSSKNQQENSEALARFESGESRVIVNVYMLTEGWNYQPVSCVILLKLESHISSLIQMFGRGMRAVDPEISWGY